MPPKNYKKGISDDKQPAHNLVRAHLTDSIYSSLTGDAASRALPVSRVLRELVTAHYERRRPEFPRAAAQNAALIRELGRIGNNLNQLTRLGNTDPRMLPVRELEKTLAELSAALERV